MPKAPRAGDSFGALRQLSNLNVGAESTPGSSWIVYAACRVLCVILRGLQGT